MRFGWLRDFTDCRDYHLDSEEAKQFAVSGAKKALLDHCLLASLPEPREQGNLGSCCSHAGTYLYEANQRLGSGEACEPMSRLFLYKTSRRLEGRDGDSGVTLRSTMQALAAFGVPPERHCPYDVARYDDEPTAFHYALAANYQALTYYRLDPHGTPPDKTIARAKANMILGRADRKSVV